MIEAISFSLTLILMILTVSMNSGLRVFCLRLRQTVSVCSKECSEQFKHPVLQ